MSVGYLLKNDTPAWLAFFIVSMKAFHNGSREFGSHIEDHRYLKIYLSRIIGAGKCSKLLVNAFRDGENCDSICDTSCEQRSIFDSTLGLQKQ